jgi:hypothetical protein
MLFAFLVIGATLPLSAQRGNDDPEMPIVELAPGEFTPLPIGGVVEFVQTPDRKVLVGWFGPIEIPFVVKRAGNEWKVEPLPYFALME